jgi:hypothetical protein
MQSESTTTAKHSASVRILTAAEFDSPQAIAACLASIREQQISELTTVIAGDSEHMANAITWRAAFCHECEGNECALGTARQLAAKVFDLGWAVESLTGYRLNCLKCQEVSQ